jgi:cobalt-zinc-cadmium efflux system protein
VVKENMSASCKHESSHHSYRPDLKAAFFIGAVLNTGFALTEIGFGWYVHSLSLIADAVHNFGDVLGLVVSWMGYNFALRKPNRNFTYGFGRVSVYATVLNGIFLTASVFWILFAAFQRLDHPQEPQTFVMGVVAAIGIAINGMTAWLLMGRSHDINVHSAVIHMLADAAVSAGVVLSAIAIFYTKWLWIDPALSAVIALVIFASGWPLLVEGTRLSLDAVPKNMDAKAIRSFLEKHPDLSGVFDLHIWALSTTKTAVSAHLTVKTGGRAEDIVHKIHRELKKKFNITHATLQVEKDHALCTDEHEQIEDQR